MKVEEIKQQARALEQQGETEAALKLYAGVLAELEGTQEIWRELPLYVKAGDLSLKLNDPSNAISQYEKAANAYAAYGSSRSVIALCMKILRVNPGHTHIFLRLVRLMIEREHLGEARLVLLEYADRLKLPKAALALQGLAGRPEYEMRPVLDMLLEMGGRYEYERAQGRDHVTDAVNAELNDARVADETAVVEDAVATSVPDVDATISLDAAEELDRANDNFSEVDRAVPEPDQPESAAESDGHQDTDGVSSGAVVSIESAPVREVDDVQWLEDRPSIPMGIPRASRQVLFREAEKRRNNPTGLWIGLGSAAVVVVVGLSLVLFGVIPFGGREDPGDVGVPSVPAEQQSDSASNVGGGPQDSSGTDAVSSAQEEADTPVGATVTRPAASALRAATAAQDSSASQVAAGGQSQQETVADSVSEEPVLELPPSQGVMVQDFDVESVTEFSVDGRIGYVTTQLLGTGELLTLSAVYYGEEISEAPGSEAMTLLPLVGDTTTALIRFNRYSVEARAVVSASVLETLLGRLVEVPRSD